MEKISTLASQNIDIDIARPYSNTLYRHRICCLSFMMGHNPPLSSLVLCWQIGDFSFILCGVDICIKRKEKSKVSDLLIVVSKTILK